MPRRLKPRGGPLLTLVAVFAGWGVLRAAAWENPFAPSVAALEHGAVGHPKMTAEQVAKLGARLVGRKGGEKTEAAAIHPDDWYLFARRLAGDAEECAVAADDAADVAATQPACRQWETFRVLEDDAGTACDYEQFAGEFGGAGFYLVHHERELADGGHMRAKR